ncbi:hypothetical protein EP7_003719 [Isosphaeraceae bacterium EP7]
MATPHRFHRSTPIMAAACLAVSGLMIYAILSDERPTTGGADSGGGDALEIAVFLEARSDWSNFRKALHACARLGIVGSVTDGNEELGAITSGRGRQLRFRRRADAGSQGLREAVKRMAERPVPPLAVIGSANSLLTGTLADQLARSFAPDAREGPLLFVPWASAVLIDAEDGEVPRRLLDVYPGRTFRFCPNNQREADLVVDGLLALDPRSKPCRALLIVDRRDPYSVDFADCFRRSIARAAPEAEIVERADGLDFSGDETGRPGPSEYALAEAAWNSAGEGRAKGATWVVLPLLEEPARRVLNALLDRAGKPMSEFGAGLLRVICGDAIGFEVLDELQASSGPFPVWCPTSGAVLTGGRAGERLTPDTQVLAEIIVALAIAVDSIDAPRPTPSDLHKAVEALDLPADDPRAFGRPLAFTRGHERKGDLAGHVLAYRPEEGGVVALERDSQGAWIATPAAVARPTE